MNVLIVGASGLAGRYLLREFKKRHNTIGTYFQHKKPGLSFLALQDKNSIRDVIDGFKPDVIIIAAATSNVDFCEVNPKETYKINVLGLENLLNIASKQKEKPRVVFFSSDYVFDGKNGPYKEQDPTNPINEYGRQKVIGERLVQKYRGKHLILRTTVLYGWEEEGKNFTENLIVRARTTKEPRSVPIDQIGTPTYASNLAEIIVDLVEKEFIGVINIVGNDLISRFDFAKKVIKVFDLPKDIIIPISSEVLNQPAQRPLNGGLYNTKLKQLISIKILNAEEGLKQMKKEKFNNHD